jgi:hypothetical protein
MRIEKRGDKMLERDIERRLRLGIKALGGKVYKFSSPGNNGVPDRIVLIQGKCYFVETKKPGEQLDPLQRAVKKDFAKLGFKVYKLSSVEDVDKFLEEVVSKWISFHMITSLQPNNGY